MGTLDPSGVLIVAGRPPITPPPRPGSDPAATPSELAINPAVQALQEQLSPFRPRARPGDLTDRAERALTGGFSLRELAAIKPRPRPAEVPAQALPQSETDADPTGEDDARLQDDAGESPVITASLQPRLRPEAKARALIEERNKPVAAAVPAPSVAPAPSLPTSASVAKQATNTNAINLRRVNLIGVYGGASDRRALVRLSSGRYVKVQVGDRLDGGQVAAIDDGALRYIKGGRSIILQVPSDS